MRMKAEWDLAKSVCPSLLAATLVLWPASAGMEASNAAGGNLDSSFGSGGKVTTDFGARETANDAALQRDGKIVAVGATCDDLNPATCDRTLGGFALARYTTNGSLDPTFGTGGKVVTKFACPYYVAQAVAIQADGKIVVAGSAPGCGNDWVLARYGLNGNLDSTFGTGGKVVTYFNHVGPSGGLTDVAIQADGKIVTVGHTFRRECAAVSTPVAGLTCIDFAVARHNANGMLDLTFGPGGTVTTDFGSAGVLTTPSVYDWATAVVVQTDRKIVVAGTSAVGSKYSFTLVRYLEHGVLDPGFGNGGKVNTEFTSSAGATDLAVQTDGKIVATGWTGGATGDFALARYLPSGALDPAFGIGGSGKTTTDLGSSVDGAAAVAIQSNGRIVAAGSSRTADWSKGDFALARYLPGGALDASFGTGGKLKTDFGGLDDASAVMIQGDGKIVAVGQKGSSLAPACWPTCPRDFALARYWP